MGNMEIWLSKERWWNDTRRVNLCTQSKTCLITFFTTNLTLTVLRSKQGPRGERSAPEFLLKSYLKIYFILIPYKKQGVSITKPCRINVIRRSNLVHSAYYDLSIRTKGKLCLQRAKFCDDKTLNFEGKGKGKVTPLQVRFWPRGG
jgi:hypothetical protein